MKRFHLGRLGVYWYMRRRTLSFGWGCRWHWLPEYESVGCDGGWAIYWGWFCLENTQWAEGDSYGQKAADSHATILTWLAEDLEAAKGGKP